MQSYRYLIVGGGMTADAAVRGIRERDEAGTIGIITEEAHPPYLRPPLSKALWKGDPLESVWRHTDSFGVDLRLRRRATHLDAAARRLTDDHDQEYAFEKLLLATGTRPRRLPFGGDDVIYFRTLDDYTRLRAEAEAGASVAVVGAGFIGTEIAAALATIGARVTLIFPEPAIGSRAFPPELASFLSHTYQEHGVEVLAGDSVEALERRGRELSLRTRSGRRLQLRAAVAGLGVEPNLELAQAAGLAVGDGIVVDELLRTTDENVFAAGDVANTPSAALGRRIRVEHEDAATTMGTAAGRLMAGADERYEHLPFFYSDLFEYGYEAVGEIDARLEIVADWKEPLREGVVYYLHDGRLRGVLLWNVWGQVDAARGLLASANQVRPEDLRGRITA